MRITCDWHIHTPVKRQYIDHIAFLRQRGVKLSIGSDCHSPTYDADFEATAAILAPIGLRDEDLWRLGPHKD